MRTRSLTNNWLVYAGHCAVSWDDVPGRCRWWLGDPCNRLGWRAGNQSVGRSRIRSQSSRSVELEHQRRRQEPHGMNADSPWTRGSPRQWSWVSSLSGPATRHSSVPPHERTKEQAISRKLGRNPPADKTPILSALGDYGRHLGHNTFVAGGLKSLRDSVTTSEQDESGRPRRA